MIELTRSDLIGLAFIQRQHADLRGFERFKVETTANTGTIVEVTTGPALVGREQRIARWQISGGGHAERTDRPTCPDGGTCHHNCGGECFRVESCAPLSNVFPNDEWPEGAKPVRAA